LKGITLGYFLISSFSCNNTVFWVEIISSGGTAAVTLVIGYAEAAA
jgi:hypothetical protein